MNRAGRSCIHGSSPLVSFFFLWESYCFLSGSFTFDAPETEWRSCSISILVIWSFGHLVIWSFVHSLIGVNPPVRPWSFYYCLRRLRCQYCPRIRSIPLHRPLGVSKNFRGFCTKPELRTVTMMFEAHVHHFRRSLHIATARIPECRDGTPVLRSMELQVPLRD